MNPSSTAKSYAQECPQPDYEPSKAFGKLVELEGDTKELHEKISQLENRLGKALRPSVPPVKACADPANLHSISGSEIVRQIETVRGEIMQCFSHVQELMERIDL